MTILGRARRYGRRAVKAFEASSHAASRKKPIRSGTVLYESFAGNGMLCNPEAIFRRLLNDPAFAELEHIWVLSDPKQYRSSVLEFAHVPNVRFVTYRSREYFAALATSQYLINNATFPPAFSKRPGQTYLNTWHGTPLKRMGYDMPNGPADSANTLRNFVAADFLLAANDFMTTTMYESAYRLAGIYRGRIIQEGYPRIDRQLLDASGAAAARRRLADAGVPVGDRTIVLYAPTWKGTSFSRPEDDVETLVEATAELQRELGDDHVVLLKTHQVVHGFASSDPQLKRILVPNEIPTNVMLGIADALVTDYSSIFFDYLATGRPIAFYTPDMADYSDVRGVYFPPRDWPGPVCTSATDAAARLRELLASDGTASGEIGERYRQWQQRFTPYEDGSVTDRVIDIVFRGGTEGLRVRDAAQDDRKKILLYLGGMRSNGITASALNLLRNVDHDRYDVSVLLAASARAQQRANQDKIHPAVRQFPRVGGMNGAKLEHLKRRVAGRRGDVELHRTDPAQRALWDEEWARCFGDVRFDDVIDFSGYSPFWATLLLHSPPATRSIWLHNDMAAEVHREVNGKKSMRRSLPAVFGLYRDFDHLVSVSPRLNELNRRQLAGYAPEERFTAVRNLIDADRVRVEARADVRELPDHPVDPDAPLLEEGAEPVRIVPDWAKQVADKQGTRWFVSVGRLSPEKNQERLLRAFAQVHREHPDSRLLIVGQGPLRGRLQEVIEELGIGAVAFLTGSYHNPFAIMAAADCFVLSSNYEGQPMVLLEAAVVGLPIVSVDFTSVHDALPNDSIHIVAQTDEALAEGMRAYLRGEVPASTIDLQTYTRDVLDEFEVVIKPLPTRRQQGS
ncbi:MAG TPA: glycosyltransferase [Humibacter sp.]|nr:glycosyltransferase [Humibacter sp.]